MPKRIIYVIITSFISLSAQTIYEPIYKTDIYNFLEHLFAENHIQLFTDIRPLTRLSIAENLLLLKLRKDELTDVEKETLEFFDEEYAFELKYMSKDTSVINEFLKFGETNRLQLFKYYSKDFTFDYAPIVGIQYELKNKTYHQYSGVRFKGRVGDNWGYYFDFRDNLEKGNHLDAKKAFTPTTGVIIAKSSKTSIEYSETRGGMTYGWNWGEMTMAKDFISIGSSFDNPVILSSKAPSFPYFRIEAHPVLWFKYNFIHAWLNSNLVDSTTIRYTGVSSTLENRSKTYSRRAKYYVGHSLSFEPYDNWWLTFGESIIYSDNIEYIYFLPVFFRLADHYNSKGGADSGDNAQLFFNTSYLWSSIRSKLYLSIYIDELSPESLFSHGNNAQVYALNLGARITNPLITDNYITLEYNVVMPYSYMNGDPAQTYMSSGYPLGAWYGSNAVQLFCSMEQYLPHMIRLKGYVDYVIKGAKENIDNYYNRVTTTYALLSGDNSYYTELGFEGSYTFIHDLEFLIQVSYIPTANGRFSKEYNITKGLTLGTTLRYGI